MEVTPGEKLILNARYGDTTCFDDEFMCESNVTDMYLHMENISRVEKVYFHVEIGK